MIEQADTLMRQTDQYSQWQQLRRKNDTSTLEIVKQILQREALLQKYATGKSINWQEFDQITQRLEKKGLHLPPSRTLRSPPFPTLPVSSRGTAAASSQSAEDVLTDDNLVILTVSCPKIGIKSENSGYSNGQTTFLPLKEFSHTVDFEIHVDPAKGKATGWFIAENREFSLDANQKKIEIDGEKLEWNEGQILVGDDDIYIDSNLLSKWFPIDIKISLGEMTALLEPREKLPIQEQYEREQRRNALLKREDLNLKYRPTQSPYEMFTIPNTDVSLSTGFDTGKSDGSNFDFHHAVVSEGDLGHMGAKIYFSGDEEHLLDNARVTLERLDQDGKLLGAMKATKVAVGDVSPVTLPILGSHASERGMALSNEDLRQSRDFDVTRFEGNAQPGWDIELYQNNNLISSTRVGSDGHYTFEDIPVYFGANSFQVLAHGPQGQRRIIETKNINVGSGMLKAGELEYKLSATQQNTTILGISEDNDEITKPRGSSRITGKLAYGLTDQFSLTAGLSSVEFEDTQHNYAQLGLNGNFSALYGEVNAIQDSAGGNGYSFQGQTAIGPVNLRAKHEIFSGMVKENEPDRVLKSHTSLGVNGVIPESLLTPSITYTLSRIEDNYDNTKDGRNSLRLSSHLGRLHISNAINWNDDAMTASSGAPIDGLFQASGSIGSGRLLAAIGYNLGSDEGVTDYKLSGYYPITQNVSAAASITREIDAGNLTTAEASLAIKTEKATFSPKISYDSDGTFSGFLTVSFSLGQDPVTKEIDMQAESRAGKGMATAFVYHDANNNKIFDQDDTPLPDVTVIARQTRKNGTTNSDGIAKITNLSAQNPTDLEIDTKTLEDPFWQPSVPGAAIMPRSGGINTIEFPVVTTGEIDGGAYWQNQDGTKEPLTDIQIVLLNSEGKAVNTVQPEYDGFFLFEHVLPGTYELHIQSETPRVKAQADQFKKKIIIGNDGTIARNQNIILGAHQEAKEQRQFPKESSHKPADSPLRVASINIAPPPFLGHKVKIAVPQHRDNEPSASPLHEKEIAATTPSSKTPVSISPLQIVAKKDQHLHSSLFSPQGPPQKPPGSPPIATRTPPSSFQRETTTIASQPYEKNKPSLSSLAHPETAGATPSSSTTLSIDPLRVLEEKSPYIQPSINSIRQGKTSLGIQTVKRRNRISPLARPHIAEGRKTNIATNFHQDTSPYIRHINSSDNFTVQLASYKSMHSAKAGIEILSKRFRHSVSDEDFRITKVDLGKGKGIYYRVSIGNFSSAQEAHRFASKLQMKTDDVKKSMAFAAGQEKEGNEPTIQNNYKPNGYAPAAVAAKYTAMQKYK